MLAAGRPGPEWSRLCPGKAAEDNGGSGVGFRIITDGLLAPVSQASGHGPGHREILRRIIVC